MAEGFDWTDVFEALAVSDSDDGPPSEARSARELAAHYGRSVGWVRDQLRPLVEEGKVSVAAHRVINMVGKEYLTYVYWRVEEGQALSGDEGG